MDSRWALRHHPTVDHSASIRYIRVYPRPILRDRFTHAGASSTIVGVNDQSTTVAELRKLIDDFVDERDWQQFHSPKNISMALAIEASELMEHFQWITIDASRQMADDPKKLGEVAEELADVMSYSLAMANSLGIDLAATIEAKMVKNAEKYPAEEFRGRFGVIENED